MSKAAQRGAFTTLRIVLSLALCVGNASADGLDGTWSGLVTQANVDDSYTVEMELHGDAGSVDYPSLHCSGALTLESATGGTYAYREHITSGADRCTDGGTIRMNRVKPSDATRWYWVWEGSGITVRGIVKGSATPQ